MDDYLSDYKSTQDNGARNSNGVGYIVLNGHIDRDTYIQNCILTGTVTIALENGGFIENVPVLKHVWNDIVFPLQKDELGSFVMWSNICKSNIVVITGVIPKKNEVINRNENEFLLSRDFADKNNITNHLEISGSAEEGIINILIDGGQNNGELRINLFNQSKSAKLTVTIKGDANFDISNDLNIITGNNATINPKNGVILGGGKEPIPLGKSLTNNITTESAAMTALFNAIKQAPITPNDGGASFKAYLVSIINGIQRGDFSSVLSKYSSTD